MSMLTKYIPEKELTLEYNAAKIIASPYDYRLTERLLLHDNTFCFNNYHIFNKTYNTEDYLCDQLGLLSSKLYMKINPKLNIDSWKEPVLQTIKELKEKYELYRGHAGTFIKYNNLILNEESLMTDFCQLKIPYIHLKTKSYLKALEVLYLKSINSDSLISNLMYLATEFSDYSLNDIENIEFAKKAVADGTSPIMRNIVTASDITGVKIAGVKEDVLLSTSIVPINFGDLSSSIILDNSLFQLGLVYSIIYGIELLYQYSKITDDTIKNALDDLLCITYESNSFCKDYLYSVDMLNNIELNPKVINCFDSNNEKRFLNIKNYLEEIVSTGILKKEPIKNNLKYFGMPRFFGRMIIDMHLYAYQIARVKHAVLLYSLAKEKGVISREDFEGQADINSELFGKTYNTHEENKLVSDELINLESVKTTSETTLSDEDRAEKEKITKGDKEATPPSLGAMDVLKKDLYDSRYDFDINYVTSNVGNQESYNTIAKNIRLITHELTKQIKEIKTYNSGGKQGGLLVGKLDKKNLWKYKTDPHIFYNNNYKLKEMDLAFGCILDESGSMSGEKIKNGRIVMIMLHEVLNSLGINHSIIGHTSSGMYNCKIFKYFQFKEEPHYTLSKPYGLVKADNRSGNCDSGSLFYMQKLMKCVKNKDKIVIIFSDGQPTECTDLDLTNQVKDMEKEGIHVIGVGINFESIKEYYPDNANGRNLKEMVSIVVSILKRYVLEKKED